MSTWVDKFYKNFERAFKGKQLTRFVDGDGYSVLDVYTGSFKRQMGLGSDSAQLPFFKFFFDAHDDASDYTPLKINVSMTTKVMEGQVTRYMLADHSVRGIRPISITSNDNFYISTTDGELYEKKKNKYIRVELSEVYQRLYKTHISSIWTFRGVMLRTRVLFLRRLPSVICRAVSWALGYLFWFIKGKRYKYDVISERYLNKDKDVTDTISTTSPSNDIDFFGYKVSVWTLFSYSFLVVIVSIALGNKTVGVLSNQGIMSGISVIAIAILTIVTYDRLLPLCVKWIVKTLSVVSFDLQYKGVKLKI